MKEFFEICARKGITLTLKDGKNISYRTSKGPLEKDILAYLKEHKTEIIEYLKSNEQADKMIDESKIIHNEKDRYQYFPLTDIQSAYYSGRQAGYELGRTGCYTYIEIKSERIDSFKQSENVCVR